MKKVMLRDVATKAGVSIASVSYVLNKAKGYRIAPETEQKIRDAAKALNYRPNSIAKSLKMKRTFTIGVLVGDIANPFFSSMARFIEEEAKKSGFNILIGSCDENAEQLGLMADTFCDRQVDGLIISPVQDSLGIIQDLQLQQIPMIMVDRFLPGLKASSVLINNFDISYQATQHLIEGGKKNITFVDYDFKLSHLELRKEGFLAALTDYGESIREDHVFKVPLGSSKTDISGRFQKLFKVENPPDALLISSNSLAIKALAETLKLKIDVPGELGIVAFDESEAFDLFPVSISHVNQPIKEMCAQAVALLIEIIDNPVIPSKEVILNAELVILESSYRK